MSELTKAISLRRDLWITLRARGERVEASLLGGSANALAHGYGEDIAAALADLEKDAMRRSEALGEAF